MSELVETARGKLDGAASTQQLKNCLRKSQTLSARLGQSYASGDRPDSQTPSGLRICYLTMRSIIFLSPIDHSSADELPVESCGKSGLGSLAGRRPAQPRRKLPIALISGHFSSLILGYSQYSIAQLWMLWAVTFPSSMAQSALLAICNSLKQTSISCHKFKGHWQIASAPKSHS